MTLTEINVDNYSEMAKAMGIASEQSSANKSKSTLARLKIIHQPIMGLAEVNNKKVNVEVIEGGSYRLELPDTEQSYYASEVRIRPYMQRFMYKRFVKGVGDTKNSFVKTVMADSLNIDLKDNSGGFNCGKPTGYIQDFSSLSDDMQSLIRQIKRVRVIFGTVTLSNPMTDQGTAIEIGELPFIWEVDNRDAFKIMGAPFQSLFKAKRLPVQHHMTATAMERKLPNGNSYYIPSVELNMSDTLLIEPSDQAIFKDFLEWINNYNEYILSAWNDNTSSNDEVSAAWDLPDDQALDIVEDFVNIGDEMEGALQ